MDQIRPWEIGEGELTTEKTECCECATSECSECEPKGLDVLVEETRREQRDLALLIRQGLLQIVRTIEKRYGL